MKPLRFYRRPLNNVECVRIDYLSVISFSFNDQIIIGENSILTAINLYGIIVDAIDVSIVKLVHAQSRSVVTAAARPDFEVIGLGAVVVESGDRAHPDFVLSAGVVGVIVATGEVGVATG